MKNFYRINSLFFLFFAMLFSAQTAGDYRSNTASATAVAWASAANWQLYNGTSWVAATEYPGQTAGTYTVTILPGDIYNSGAATYSIGNLVVQGTFNISAAFTLSTTTKLTIDGGSLAWTGNFTFTLTPANASIILVNGGSLATDTPCNANKVLQIGTEKYASCSGGTAYTSFAALNSSGGTLNAAPTATPSSIVSGQSVSLSGPYTGFINAPITYNWSGTGSGGYTFASSVQNPGSVTLTTKGNYIFTYTVSNTSGVTVSDTESITVFVDGNYDGDLVGDATDLDDDNDGILDTVECNATEKVLNGTFGANLTSGNLTNWTSVGNWGLSASNPTFNPRIELLNDAAATSTLSQTITGLEPGKTYTLNFSVGANVLGTTKVATLSVLINGSSIYSQTASQIVTDAGGFSWTLVNKSATFVAPANGIINLVIQGVVAPGGGTGNDLQADNFSLIACKDTDGDGIPDVLDLDSDNDGCLDALEGGNNLATSNLVNSGGTVTVGTGSTAANQNLGNTVDANGVPTIVSGGQTAGSSTNSAVKATVCLTPFVCSDSKLYVSSLVTAGITKLTEVAIASGAATYTPQIGTTTTPNYNATAFNSTNGFIYAINASYELVRIDANGVVNNLGLVTSLPSVSIYNAGEIDNAGNYYVKQTGSTNIIYKINIAGMTAAAIPTLSTSINVGDFAYNVTTGLLYGVHQVTNQFVSINPTTGAVIFFGASTGVGNAYGAMFGAPNGIFGIDGVNLYSFDLTTGARTVVSTVPSDTSLDGAHCVTAPIMFVCYNPITNTASGTNTNHGITLLKRAGSDNGNWPMIVKSAHTALESNTKGFVVTRMTSDPAQTAAANHLNKITNPQEGMMVYDIFSKCLKIYADGVWSCFSTPACP